MVILKISNQEKVKPFNLVEGETEEEDETSSSKVKALMGLTPENSQIN